MEKRKERKPKGFDDRLQASIRLLKKAEPLALRYSADGFFLAFSGGKDSQALYHVARMAGVRFQAFMSATSVDPPEVLRFVRSRYPDVTVLPPRKASISEPSSEGCCPVITSVGAAPTSKKVPGQAASRLPACARRRVPAVPSARRLRSAVISLRARWSSFISGRKRRSIISGSVCSRKKENIWARITSLSRATARYVALAVTTPSSSTLCWSGRLPMYGISSIRWRMWTTALFMIVATVGWGASSVRCHRIGRSCARSKTILTSSADGSRPSRLSVRGGTTEKILHGSSLWGFTEGEVISPPSRNTGCQPPPSKEFGRENSSRVCGRVFIRPFC